MSSITEATNNQRFITILRYELLAKLTDDWQGKWAQKHGDEIFKSLADLPSQEAFLQDLMVEMRLTQAKIYGDREAFNRTISPDTFVRFFDENYTKTFSKKTLDIIAEYVDYKSFNDFIKKQTSEPPAQVVNVFTLVHKPKPEDDPTDNFVIFKPDYQKIYRLLGAIGAFIVAGLSMYIYLNQYLPNRHLDKIEIDDIQFKILRQNNTYNPAKVTFGYDYSLARLDSLTLNFNNNNGDKELNSAKITDKKGEYTFDFYKPGLHKVDLMHKNQILKSEMVYIKSHGWACWYWYFPDNWFNPNLPYKNFYNNGQLCLLPQNIVDLVHRNNYASIIVNVKDFKIDGDSVTVEYDIKNSPEEFGISCYDHYLELQFSNQKIFNLSFQRQGCDNMSPKNQPVTIDAGFKNRYHWKFAHIFYDWEHVKIIFKTIAS